MKNWLVLSALFVLCSCMNIAKDVSPNTVVSDDLVYVAGKVSFEPEVKQELNILAPNTEKMVSFTFCVDDKVSPDELENMLFTVYKTWGEYFIVAFPKQNMYLRRVRVLVKKGMNSSYWLNIRLAEPIRFDKNDNFVYFGDLVFHFGVKNELGGDDNILEVKDNIAKAGKKFAGYVKDRKGKAVALKPLLLKGGRVNAEVICESISMMRY